MKKTNKIVLASLLLVFFGLGLMIIGTLLGGSVYGFRLNGDGFHVNSPAFEENDAITYTKENITLEAFDNIEVEAKYLDFKVIPQDNYGIAYNISSQTNLSYEITDKTLKITENYQSSDNIINFQWFSGFPTNDSYEEEYLEIYVPQNAALNSVTLDVRYGNVSLDDLNANTISIYNEYGDMEIDELSASSFITEMDYGELEIENSSFQSLTANMEYGNLNSNMVSCDDATLSLEYGDCQLENFTVSSINAQLKYGTIDLNLTAPITEYGYNLSTKYGDIDIDGFKATQNDGHDTILVDPADSSKQIEIYAKDGDIKITANSGLIQ